MEVMDGKVKIDVRKSTGRMLVLMLGTGLRLRKYQRGPRVFYTLEPLGPIQGSLVYDYFGSSPVRYEQKTVDDSLGSGYIELSEAVEVRGERWKGYLTWEGSHYYSLTALGRRIAGPCRKWWESEIDGHFAGRGFDWRDLGKHA